MDFNRMSLPVLWLSLSWWKCRLESSCAWVLASCWTGVCAWSAMRALRAPGVQWGLSEPLGAARASPCPLTFIFLTCKMGRLGKGRLQVSLKVLLWSELWTWLTSKSTCCTHLKTKTWGQISWIHFKVWPLLSLEWKSQYCAGSGQEGS